MTQLKDAYPPNDGKEYKMMQLVTKMIPESPFRRGPDPHYDQIKTIRISAENYDKMLGGDELPDNQMHFSDLKDLQQFIDRSGAVVTDALKEDNTPVPAELSVTTHFNDDLSIVSQQQAYTFRKNGVPHDAVSNGKPSNEFGIGTLKAGERIPASTEIRLFPDSTLSKNYTVHEHHYDEGEHKGGRVVFYDANKEMSGEDRSPNEPQNTQKQIYRLTA